MASTGDSNRNNSLSVRLGQAFYTAGETLSGFVRIHAPESIVNQPNSTLVIANQLVLHFRGVEETIVVPDPPEPEEKNKDDDDSKDGETPAVLPVEDPDPVVEEHTLIECSFRSATPIDDSNISLDEGHFQVPFEFDLPWTLPTSFSYLQHHQQLQQQQQQQQNPNQPKIEPKIEGCSVEYKIKATLSGTEYACELVVPIKSLVLPEATPLLFEPVPTVIPVKYCCGCCFLQRGAVAIASRVKNTIVNKVTLDEMDPVNDPDNNDGNNNNNDDDDDNHALEVALAIQTDAQTSNNTSLSTVQLTLTEFLEWSVTDVNGPSSSDPDDKTLKRSSSRILQQFDMGELPDLINTEEAADADETASRESWTTLRHALDQKDVFHALQLPRHALPTYRGRNTVIRHELQIEVVAEQCCMKNSTISVPVYVVPPARLEETGDEVQLQPTPSDTFTMPPMTRLLESSVGMIEESNEKPSIAVLLRRLGQSSPSLSSSYALVEACTVDSAWASVWASIRPDEFRQILTAMEGSPMNQTLAAVAVARAMASSPTGFSGWYAVAALQVVTSNQWNRCALLHALVKTCTKVIKPECRDAMRVLLTEWEQLVTNQVIDEAMAKDDDEEEK